MKKLIFGILVLQALFSACEKVGDENGGQNSEVGGAGQISLTVTTYNVLKPDASARHETNMSMNDQKVRQALASTIATTQSDIIVITTPIPVGARLPTTISVSTPPLPVWRERRMP